MTFDVTAPHRLVEQQKWFASIITRPLVDGKFMLVDSPLGVPMEVEAARYLVPSPTLEPHQRIQIYNQQYWWRLLSTLQDFFPLVLRLFGYNEFNERIAIPYLQAYPSTHWSLNFLGCHMLLWAQEDYVGEDRPLVIDSIALDLAHTASFFARQHPPFTADVATSKAIEQLLEVPVKLQPHISLHSFSFELANLRKDLLKEEPEYWIENPFPKMEKREVYGMVFRNVHNLVIWKELDRKQWEALALFKKPFTISELCDHYEDDPEVAAHLKNWLQIWTTHAWLLSCIR